MDNFIILGIIIFIIAVTMTMVGKGGGNFYVAILTIANIPMYEAATIGQFILFSASFAAILTFQKNKSVSWSLSIIMGLFISTSAFLGGYYSHMLTLLLLKLIFAIMLIISGAVMLIPVSPQKNIAKQFLGILNLKINNEYYKINLWIILPITIMTGFVSGMVGVSGGSFLVPLLVLSGIPMYIAVGTSSSLILITSFMGFIGHTIHGDFNMQLAFPLAIIALLGGAIGGKFTLKAKPINLKKLFAYTNWLAALIVIIKII